MKNKSLTLVPLSGVYAVCRLSPDESVPHWAMQGDFFSISKTSDELSVVCEERHVPAGVKSETGWRGLKVQGPLDFGLTGILASLANPLANAGISIFAVSTFDTDYLLIRSERFEDAVSTLTQSGHQIKL